MDLISLLVVILIIGLIFYVLQMVPIPDPWRTVAIVIVAIIVIIYLLRMIGFVHAASAQALCGPADKVVPGLAEKFQERPIFEGEGGPSFVVSMFLNQTTGSWTILIINRRSNLACVAAGGMKSRVLEALHLGEPL